jgi:hypothetical protein
VPFCGRVPSLWRVAAGAAARRAGSCWPLTPRLYALAGLSLLTDNAALSAGALTGRRTYGLAAGAAVGVLGYVFNAVGRQTKDVEWLLGLIPNHCAYGDSAVAGGANWAAAACCGAFQWH